MELPKGLSEGVVMLNMDSPTFADDLANAMGVAPGDKINICTPQFERCDGVVGVDPSTVVWNNVRSYDHDTLVKMGFGVWEKDEAKVHYLIPHSWYDFVPDGWPLLCIDGEESLFKKGETDDDQRYGMIAYGFVVYLAKCDVPPPGWYCTREAGHEGPCAAYEKE